MPDIEAIARVCHEANRGLQATQPDSGVPVAAPWDEETEAQRHSVRLGVQGILNGKTPEESHEAWCAHKRTEGWVYGPVKDLSKMTHPCLVPYSELPADQQVKDHLFSAIVKALA